MTGMPAWSASHDDKALWPVVAFMTVLPKLSAAPIPTNLCWPVPKVAGHHAAGDDRHSHPDAASESTGHHGGDQSHQDQPGNGEVTEHEHSTDSHGDKESAGEKKNQQQGHDHNRVEHTHLARYCLSGFDHFRSSLRSLLSPLGSDPVM